MKICVPTETSEGQTANVYAHFGSAPFFTIVDSKTGATQVIPNSNEHHAHGTCQPISALAGVAVDVIVTGGMGARAVLKLNEGGIKVYRAVPGTVAHIAEQFSKGGLEELTSQNACAHHDCH